MGYAAYEFDLARGERTSRIMYFDAKDLCEAADKLVYTLNLKQAGWKKSPACRTVGRMTGNIGWHLVKEGSPAHRMMNPMQWTRFSNPGRQIRVERGAEVLAASEEIRHLHRSEGMTLDQAARIFTSRHPDVALRAMERLGSWPSSEPELAALQRTWK